MLYVYVSEVLDLVLKLLLFWQFSKGSGKHVEEKKLKVVLISPPSSPVLLPVNGDLKQDSHGQVHVQKDRLPTAEGVENIPPPLTVSPSPFITAISFSVCVSLSSFVCEDLLAASVESYAIAM